MAEPFETLEVLPLLLKGFDAQDFFRLPGPLSLPSGIPDNTPLPETLINQIAAGEFIA